MGASPSQGEEDQVKLEHVVLNVYDLGTSTFVQRLNTALSFVGTGAFHVGVEVFGQEWSFAIVLADDGTARSEGKTGVIRCLPRCAPGHTYRESVAVGFTALPRAGVQRVLQRLAKDWQSAGYHGLARNCVHFSDTLLHELGVGPIPAAYKRLTDYGLAASESLSLSAKSLPRAFTGKDDKQGVERLHGGKPQNPSLLQYCTAFATDLPWTPSTPYTPRCTPRKPTEVTHSDAWAAHRHTYTPTSPWDERNLS